MNRLLKIFFKGIGILIAFILILFLILWMALQQSSVQNFVVDKATAILSETLQTKVEIGSVDIDFVKTLVAQDIYIEDQTQDTLVYAKRLSASIGLFSLFGQEIHLSEIALVGSRIKLDRNPQDSLFNFQFIVDAFTSDTTTVDTTAAAWGIDIDRLRIEEANLTLTDRVAPYNLKAQIGEFTTDIQRLDLENSAVQIDQIYLTKSGLDYNILKPNVLENALAEVVTDTLAGTTTTELAFPDFGWQVQVYEVSLSDNYVTYSDRNYDALTNGLDVNYLTISDLNLGLKNIELLKEKINLELTHFSFKEKDFHLSDFSTQILVTPQQIQITDFLLKTPQSIINNETKLTFAEFNDLVHFMDAVSMDIHFDQTKISFTDLSFLAPQLKDIPQLNLDLKRDLTIDGKVVGTVANLQKIDLKGRVGDDLILKVKGSAQGLPDVEKMRFGLQLQELSTSYAGLQRLTNNVGLPPALADFGRFRLSGNFSGTQNDIVGENMRFQTSVYTGFKGDLVAKNITDATNAIFDLDINYLRTQAEDIAGFIEGEVPAELQRLGQIQYVGKFNGTTTDFTLIGDLSTELGNMNSDIALDFNADYTDANYDGEFAMQNFQLGALLGDTLNVGEVSFRAEVDGSGIEPTTLQTELKAVVESFNYLDYDYKNLLVNGNVNGQQFSGQAQIKDEHIDFTFNGLVNLNDSIPEMRFAAQIDTINLKKLNLTPEPYALSLQMDSDLVGSNADDLIGDLYIQDLHFSNGVKTYQTDTMSLIAKQLENKNKSIRFDSDIANFFIEGDYSVADLPALMTNFVNDFFPIEEAISPQDRPTNLALEPQPQPAQTLPDQQFKFGLGIRNPLPLTQLFVPQLTQLDTAFLIGNFDSQAKKLQLEGRIPELEYDGMTIDAIDLEIGGDTRQLNANLRIMDFISGTAAPIPLIELHTKMYDDSLFVAAVVENDTSGQKLRLGMTATEINGNYQAVLDEQFVLNGEEWKIPVDNAIIYDHKSVQVKNLTFKKNRQQISINTRESGADEQDYPIAVAFANFKLSEISELLDQPDAFYEGRVNGEAVVRDYRANLHYEVDLNVMEIILNQEPVGDLRIQAAQASGSEIIDIAADLSGQNNDMEVDGTYNIANSAIAIDANLGGVEMRLLDPFMAGLIKESKGTVNGKFAIGGTAETLQVNGQMGFNQVSTLVEMLGIRYAIQEQPTVKISNTLIDMGRIKLVDEASNGAVFSGQIRHDFFANFDLDLNFNTDRLQVLNTTVNDNELYYGQLFASADVRITGSSEQPVVNVIRARTLSGSQLFIQPLTYEAALTKEDFIIFANPAEYEQDTTISINDVYQINSSGIDLLMNLAVTDAAELQIIIDPNTGDKLVARGNANITVEMNPTGDVAVTGNYVLSNGTYNLNYQGILKKEFRIQSGSSISLVGDPLNSRFDITALYTAKTTTYELVANEANLSPAEESATQQRTDINVVMQMSGTLDEPIIQFDIRLPESLSSTVSSTVARKLTQLKENETEMNKQVFGLLLLGGFITPQSGGGNIAGVGQSAALRSASSLISNQLNSLADRFVKGVDLNFGVDSYQNKYAGDSGGTVTELQVGLSKSLFDDRLSITVGGNVNVGSSQITGGNNTAISSEFIVEYKITEAGNYLFRVFRRPDVTDILSQDNDYKTGVGLIFQKTF